MPDITMCKGENCHLKEKCYRYMAIPSEYRQAYFYEAPYKDGECEFYTPIMKGDRIVKSNEDKND